MTSADDFWEHPDVVDRFATRAPDQRLLALLAEYDEPASSRVLDVGCAGGRNTVLLAERGFDVHARDTSTAMVEETRRRVAEILGEREAAERVRLGRMDDLTEFDDGAFDLVVSLGVLHNAGSWAEWERAVAETARVLRPGGRLLLSQFTPETDLTGEGVRPIPGEPHLYEGFPAGRATLLEPDVLDAEMRRYGFVTEVATTVGRTITGETRRVSVNALYRMG